MDKTTVEFMLGSRAPADIVNSMTKELDENVIGQSTKTQVGELLNATAICLCYLRDQGQMKLTFQALADATTFDGLLNLFHRHNIPEDYRKPILIYLRELPGFPIDALDIKRLDKTEDVLAKYDFTTQRQQNESNRSYFMKPAIAAGLIKAPAPPPGATGATGHVIRPLADADRAAVTAQIKKHWKDEHIAWGHEFVDTGTLPGFVAIEGGRVIASLTYRVIDGLLHVVTLASDKEKRGVGGSLLKEAEAEAKRQKLPKVLISTDNANLVAYSFYQRRGYVLSKAHINIMDMLRFEKPTIPKEANRIPLRDQLDFVKDVNA
jgi:GNAT superfamily N-acetyltransferase